MTTNPPREFKPLKIAVLTVSDTRNEATDKSGALLVERLRAAGHTPAAKAIVRDDIYAIRAVVSGWIADAGVEVIVTTGGTGIGLALVRKFAAALGGSVRAENNDGAGCTISMMLPRTSS